jgi:hypothetical protein
MSLGPETVSLLTGWEHVDEKYYFTQETLPRLITEWSGRCPDIDKIIPAIRDIELIQTVLGRKIIDAWSSAPRKYHWTGNVSFIKKFPVPEVPTPPMTDVRVLPQTIETLQAEHTGDLIRRPAEPMTDVAVPDQTEETLAVPHVAMPDVWLPDQAHETLQMPSVAMPDVWTPDQTEETLNVPHVAMPDAWTPDQTTEVLSLPKSSHPEPVAEVLPDSPEPVEVAIFRHPETSTPVSKRPSQRPKPSAMSIRNIRRTPLETSARRRNLPISDLVKLAVEQGDNPTYRMFRNKDLAATTLPERKKVNQLLGQRIVGGINYLIANPDAPMDGPIASELAGVLRLGLERYADRINAAVTRYRKWDMLSNHGLRRVASEAALLAHINICQASSDKSSPIFEQIFARELRRKLIDSMFDAALVGALYPKHEKNMGVISRALKQATEEGTKKDKLMDAIMEKAELPPDYGKEYIIVIDQLRIKIQDHLRKITSIAPRLQSAQQRQEETHLTELTKQVENLVG